MKRFFQNLVSKRLVGKSLDDYNQQNFVNFCLANSLTNTDMQTFRVDRSVMNPNFWVQTYIGTCSSDGAKSGLIVAIDEFTGFATGDLYPIVHAERIDEAVRAYAVQNHSCSNLMNYFTIVVCEGDTRPLRNSGEYLFE